MNDYGRSRIPFVFIIDFNMIKPMVFRMDELEENDIWISTPQFSNHPSKMESIDFRFNKIPVNLTRYQKAYQKARKAIIRGDTFLLNLTFPTDINTSLSLDQIFEYGKAKYKLRVQDLFAVFSPEPFISINGYKISSFPMKGTMDLAIRNAEKRLMEDIKEISEHNTIVDLIRNDLSMVARNVRVDKFRYIEKIKTHEKELLQTSSEISGELPPNWNEKIGDILFKLLPAGSISGAPKQKTIEIIQEAENYERGYFTGVFGYFDGNGLESAVMIRYIEKLEDKLIFKSGGGITYFSDCEQEYQELIDKVYVPIEGCQP